METKTSTITFSSFTSFWAMVSGAVVKYPDCAVEEFKMRYEKDFRLQARGLYEQSGGTFTLAPEEYEQKYIEMLELDSPEVERVVCVYTFVCKSSGLIGLIAFEPDIVMADKERQQISIIREHMSDVESLRDLYGELSAKAMSVANRWDSDNIHFGDDELDVSFADSLRRNVPTFGSLLCDTRFYLGKRLGEYESGAQ